MSTLLPMNKRDSKVMVRFDSNERSLLEAAARGQPVSTFVRLVVLRAADELLTTRAERGTDD